MTEAEWLSCADPGAMLHALRDDSPTMYRTRWQGWVQVRPWRSSERKLRLFACACCWRIADALLTQTGKAVISAAEKHADGLADFLAVERAVALADYAEQATEQTVGAQSPDEVFVGQRSFEALACLWRAAGKSLPKVVVTLRVTKPPHAEREVYYFLPQEKAYPK